MKRRLFALFFSLAVCHLAAVAAAAQDQPQPSANLSLQIFFKQSPTPGYVSVEPAGTLWHASYPGLNEEERGRLKDSVEVAMHWVRQDVLNRLTGIELQASATRDDKLFRTWLMSQQTYFGKWPRSLTQ